MSEAKIAKIEGKINDIVTRPTYSTTPAWQQEVAELRLQIEALRNGVDVQRHEYERLTVDAPQAAAVAVAVPSPEDVGELADDGLDPEHHVMEQHHDAPYIGIWIVLLVLTVLEWKAAQWFGMTGLTLWIGLSVMALVKAALVAFYFMHLIFEKKLIHFLLTIPIVLVAIMILLLIPDARAQIWDYLSFGS